jgi:hypothetical protein
LTFELRETLLETIVAYLRALVGTREFKKGEKDLSDF